MLRLGWISSVVLAAILAACSGGDIESDIYDGLSPKEQVALEKWVEQALPILSRKCVPCHGGSMPEIAYLGGINDIERRKTLRAYMPAVINLNAPASSRMLTKGAHTGPALEGNEPAALLEWIVAERDARDESEAIRSEKITPLICTSGAPGTASCPINKIDLASLGQPGSVELVVQQLVADSYLANITITPGAAGLHIVHPLFESWPAAAEEPVADPIDRWFNVDLQLDPNGPATPIGTGEGTFTGFKATDPLSIRFDVYEMKTN